MKDKIMNCLKIPGRGGCAQQSHSEAGQLGPNLILLYTIFGRKGITFFVYLLLTIVPFSHT